MPVQAMVGPRKPGQRKPLLRPAREPATEGCGALETGSTAPFLILNNKGISLHQLDTAYNTLIQESRTAIASAEQAINDYVADTNHDVLHIQNLPEMLHQVSGAARFLQMPISASMLSQLTHYLEQRLTLNYPLNNSALEHIADVLMSVDYYLQSYEHNRPINRQSLDIAQNSLTQLLVA